MLKSTLAALAASLALTTAALAEVPRVVASVKPIHSLVAQVMGDLGSPDLIVDGAASPHSYNLRPSDAAALQDADLVFWIGGALELFLADSIGTLAPNAVTVELSASPGITLLPQRQGGTFERTAEEEGAEPAAGEADIHAEEPDMHFFLDPEAARVMVGVIAQQLAAVDADNAATYAANAEVAKAGLDELVAETTAKLAPLRERPFVLFHDVSQYFEQRFAIDAVGSITVTPDVAAGADRIGNIRDKLQSLDAACVFSEPNFDNRVVATLIEDTGAKSGVLDPEGANLDAGPGMYRHLIANFADSLADCLQQ